MALVLHSLSSIMRRCYAVAQRSFVIVICRRGSNIRAGRSWLKLPAQVFSSIYTVLHPRSFRFLEVGSLSRLRELLVGGCGHVSSDLDQDGLHGEVAFPGCYAGELGEVDLLAGLLVWYSYTGCRVLVA